MVTPSTTTRARSALLTLLLSSLAAGAWVPEAAADRRERDGLRSELTDQSQEAYKHFRFGLQYFQQGLLRRAETELHEALKVQETYPEAHYMLAIVYLELNEFERALHEANRALQENPLFTEAHNVLGLVHARMGSHEAALAEFQAVLGDINFPTPEVAHFNIGKVFWEQGNCSDAVLHFRRALEVNDEFGRAWYLMGDCEEQLGSVAKARSSYLKAIEHGTEQVGPMYRLGYVCYQQGDTARARKWFDEVRALAPGSDMAEAAREYVRAMDFR